MSEEFYDATICYEQSLHPQKTVCHVDLPADNDSLINNLKNIKKNNKTINSVFIDRHRSSFGKWAHNKIASIFDATICSENDRLVSSVFKSELHTNHCEDIPPQ